MAVLNSGYYFNEDWTQQHQRLKDLLDRKMTEFLDKHLKRFVRNCYKMFRGQHTYVQTVPLIPCLVDSLYKDGNMSWLTRRRDLYNLRFYNGDVP